MDPLSISTAVIALATFAEQTRRSLNRLRSEFKALPGRLDATNNDVADLEILLNQLAGLIKERHADPMFGAEGAYDQIADLVHRGRQHLHDLRDVVSQIEKAGAQSRTAAIQRLRTWRKHLPRLNDIQERIVATKSSVHLILGAAHSLVLVPLHLHFSLCSRLAGLS